MPASDPFSPRPLPELLEAVNAWCATHGVAPANAQAAEALSVRNARYYRTLGLLDAPEAGGGYGEKHFLQLCGIRLLQARGLSLRRIQELLYGRTLEDLREMSRRGLAEAPAPARAEAAGFSPMERWQVMGLTAEFALLSRSGALPSAAQLDAIRAILEGAALISSKPQIRSKPNHS